MTHTYVPADFTPATPVLTRSERVTLGDLLSDAYMALTGQDYRDRANIEMSHELSLLMCDVINDGNGHPTWLDGKSPVAW